LATPAVPSSRIIVVGTAETAGSLPMASRPFVLASAGSRRGQGVAWAVSVQGHACGLQRRSSRVLLTTLTLDSAITAPATTGSSRPAAASGMPTTL
jgi:hypothetical protein